jgi:hypothetical protein
VADPVDRYTVRKRENSLYSRPVSTTKANPPRGGDAKPRDLDRG